MFRSHKARTIIIFLAIVAIGYAIVRWSDGQGGVPQDFTGARTQGALIAENIVNLSNQSTATLDKVSKLDNEGNYKDALTLTTGLVTQSAQIRNQAVALSEQIATMTQALSGVSNLSARQDALEAISDQVALLNQLVSYSADLGSLLGVLRERFTGAYGTTAKVQALVDQVNTDVNAINNFNAQAEKAMAKFDAREGGQQ